MVDAGSPDRRHLFPDATFTGLGWKNRRVLTEPPLARPGRKRMLRNLCVAPGNCGAVSAEAAEAVRPVLERAAEDRSELVREQAEWGVGRAGFSRAEQGRWLPFPILPSDGES